MRYVLILLILSGPNASPCRMRDPALTTVEFTSLSLCEDALDAVLVEATTRMRRTRCSGFGSSLTWRVVRR